MGFASSTRGKLAALAVAVALVLASGLAVLPGKAYAALTAGSLAETATLESLGYTFTPSWLKSYSVSAGKLVAGVRTDTDAQFYEFQVARDAAFISDVRTMTVQTPVVTFTGLAKGKKYYVRARSYGETINGVTKTAADLGVAVYKGWQSNWSATQAVTVCKKPGKNKAVGKWRLTSSNWRKSIIKFNNRHGHKFVLMLKKSGKGTMRDFDKKSYKLASWGVTGKKTGSLGMSTKLANSFGAESGTYKVKGKKLTMKIGSYKLIFKKM